MFRSVVRLQSRFGGVNTFCKARPKHELLRCVMKYSTASAERKRFYQDVSISQGEGGSYEVNSDRRKLKTPSGKSFTVPNEASAIAVATEWDAQKDSIRFYTMHSTTSCNTASDNPTQRSKEQMISAASKFSETDTICYRVDEPAGSVESQKNEWDPVSHWMESRYNVTIGSSSSISGPEIPEGTRDTFRQHSSSYTLWSSTGSEFVITQSKSSVLSSAMIDRHSSVEQAVSSSRSEEEYQIRRWGNVEWAHDYDMYESQARTAAGASFVHLSSESSTVKHKLMQD